MTDDIRRWAADRARGARQALRRAADPSGLVHRRPQFGQLVRARPGAVLASPRRALWDPEPDYFYHWVRDAAVVMRLAPLLSRGAETAEEARFWRRCFGDWLRFSLAVTDPAAPALTVNPLRDSTADGAARFLRPDAELAAVQGLNRMGEPRWSADGGPDLERWDRPQHDGPALRATTCLAALEEAPELDGPDLRTMLTRDLDFLCSVAGAPSIGPWEEAPARGDTFTLLAQWDALDRAAALAAREGETARAIALRAAAGGALSAAAPARSGGVWRAAAAQGAPLDAAVALALVWAGRRAGPLALDGPDAVATCAALEALFAGLYPVNHGAAAPAIGRFEADIYFGGNPWLPTTLAFAERCYRLAADHGGGVEALARGDAFLAWARRVSPSGDLLPEQIDCETGGPAGCLDLAWSAAAFLSAVAARARAAQIVGTG